MKTDEQMDVHKLVNKTTLHQLQQNIVEMESYKVMNNVTQEVDISEMDVMKLVN
jgi:hypothetical protein